MVLGEGEEELSEDEQMLEARKNNGETNVNLFPINDLQQCYNDLWQKCQSAIEKEYEDKPADLQYFYDVTD